MITLKLIYFLVSIQFIEAFREQAVNIDKIVCHLNPDNSEQKFEYLVDKSASRKVVFITFSQIHTFYIVRGKYNKLSTLFE